jgi:hypothetical protein
MKPTAALLLALAVLIHGFFTYWVYAMSASTADTAAKAQAALAAMPVDRNAPVSFAGSQLSMECSKTLRPLIEASAVRDSSLGGALNNAVPLMLFVLVLQIAIGVVLFLVPGRVWQRIDG